MVAVVTDSASNLPEGIPAALGIQVVPLWLRLGTDEYRDGVDMAPTRFYERLAQRRERASTAAPSAGQFLEAFARTGQAEVVCITVASTMSAVHRQASVAAERFDGRAVVVDSEAASMAEGFVVLEAARLAATGASLEAVGSRARDVAVHCGLFATVNTFEFLQRSGRVSKLQAYAATALDINPVFAFRRGDPSALARPRTRRRAIERVEAETMDAVGDRPAHVAVIHAAARAEAEAQAASIAARTSAVELHVVEVTPVIGAHTGPGLIGTAFFCE